MIPPLPTSDALREVALLPLANGATARIAEIVAPLDAATSSALAGQLAAIDPWRRYGFSVDRLQRFLSESVAGAPRYLVAVGDELAGVVVLKPGWMFGTYLKLLAVLPTAQGRGLGGAILDWMQREGEARGERNQFVATSAFNAGALRFYERHGFVRVANLPGLINDTETEILLRRRLGGG